MSNRPLRHLNRLHRVAPVLAIASALLLPQALPHESHVERPDGAELETVAAAVDAVPYRVGSWAGQDIAIPEAARRLLRPNAMLSRRFINLQDARVLDLVIVHCGDSRDMLGHYPPVCYPSNGWTTSGSDGPGDFVHGDRVTVPVHRCSIPARVYGFTREHRTADTSHIRIFNFFILPNGVLTADIEDVGLRTNWLGARVTGVAQIQILTDARVSESEAMSAAGEILEALEEFFESLGVNLHEEEHHHESK